LTYFNLTDCLKSGSFLLDDDDKEEEVGPIDDAEICGVVDFSSAIFFLSLFGN